MIAKLILTALLCIVLVYALIAARGARFVAFVFVLLSVAGAYFVWFPRETTRLAHAVGIGRGADLVLYVWVIVSLLAVLNLHLKLKSQLHMLTKVARSLALYEARNSDQLERKGDRA